MPNGNEETKVAIVSGVDGLVIDFTEKVLANFCRVNLYSENNKAWQDAANHLKDNKYFSIFGRNYYSEIYSHSHIVFFSTYFSLGGNILEIFKRDKSIINDVLGTFEIQKGKLYFVFPYFLYTLKEEIEVFIQKYIGNSQVVYCIYFVGEVIGPRVNLKIQYQLDDMIQKFLLNNSISVPQRIFFYPISVHELSRYLVKDILSFVSNNRKVVLGSRITGVEIARLLSGGMKKINMVDGGKESSSFSGENEAEFIRSDIEEAIKDELTWFNNQRLITEKNYNQDKINAKSPVLSEINTETVKKRSIPNRIKYTSQYLHKFNKHFFSILINFKRGLESGIGLLKKSNIKSLFVKLSIINKPFKIILKYLKLFKKLNPNHFKIIKIAILVIFILVVFPYLSFLVSVGSFIAGQKALTRSNFKFAREMFSTTSVLNNVVKGQLGVYIEVTGVNFFPILSQYSNSLSKISGIALRSSRIAGIAGDLASDILEGKAYDLDIYRQSLTLDLDYLYLETGFLVSDIESLKGIGSERIKSFLYLYDVQKMREEIVGAKKILDNLPWLLGMDKKRQYLLLFQNNMELRPTGGFIGSFALINFDRGNLVDFNVYDVYDADGQLKGYVEPPKPLSDYLKVDSWYLRDSNWDQDFVLSAEKAEWFLDKELGEKVDGVVGVDLNAVRGLIEVFGEVSVPDYQKTLNAKNFYDITQYESEKEFFPGSRGKANFLSSLAKQILIEFSEPGVNYLKISSIIYRSLESRFIQLKINNEVIQKEIAQLGWDGGVSYTECKLDNCVTDYLSIIEANLGVNKANIYIQRSADLTLSLNNQSVKRNLSIKFDNIANPALGNKGNYKSYIRLYLPDNVEIDKISLVGNDNYREIDPDINYISGLIEVGFLIEIPPNSERTLVASWVGSGDLKLDKSGEYRLEWRKQAGIEKLPINITFMVPGSFVFASEPLLSLTNPGVYIYNTNLLKDGIFRIFW